MKKNFIAIVALTSLGAFGVAHAKQDVTNWDKPGLGNGTPAGQFVFSQPQIDKINASYTGGFTQYLKDALKAYPDAEPKIEQPIAPATPAAP